MFTIQHFASAESRTLYSSNCYLKPIKGFEKCFLIHAKQYSFILIWCLGTHFWMKKGAKQKCDSSGDKQKNCVLIMGICVFLSGSIFLESELDRPIHQSYRLIVESVNKDPNFLNGTRIDSSSQFALDNAFDAYQKVCMEMQYRQV